MNLIFKKYLLFVLISLCFTNTYAIEFGMASMFSDNFHNKKTASGELYDLNKMTASHKSLPFGSKIKITRLDNNQSVIVRVNDRGPYTKGRIVEVSRKAAREIGLNDGEVKVKIEVISTTDDEAKPKPAPLIKDDEPEPQKITVKGVDKKKKIELPKEVKNLPKPAEIAETPKTTPVKPTKSSNNGKLRSGELMKIQVAKPDREGFGLQVATLSNYEAAISKIDELEGDFYKNVLIFSDKNGEKPIYKVILGPFPDVTTAETYKKAAKKKKLDGFIINLRTMERP